MQRRYFLATVGTSFIAGCSSSEPAGDGSETPTKDSTTATSENNVAQSSSSENRTADDSTPPTTQNTLNKTTAISTGVEGQIKDLSIDYDDYCGVCWTLEYIFSGESYEHPQAEIAHQEDGVIDRIELWDYPANITPPSEYHRIGGQFEIRLMWQGEILDTLTTTINPMHLAPSFRSLDLDQSDYSEETFLYDVEMTIENQGDVTVSLVELVFEVEGRNTSATGGGFTWDFLPPLEPGQSQTFWDDPNAVFKSGETQFSLSVWYNGGSVGSTSISIDDW